MQFSHHIMASTYCEDGLDGIKDLVALVGWVSNPHTGAVLGIIRDLDLPHGMTVTPIVSLLSI
jgi:hypothetical protein